MKTIFKPFAIFFLFAALLLTFTSPVQAFDGRTGENIVIKADEVVNDDLYVSANTFTLDGTVKGDLVVFGTIITINGTIEGDLIAAGQTIVINGTVKDDVRIAGAILQVGDKASIGSDLVAAGASLEAKDGSKVGNDLVVAAAQALLAGDVTRNVQAGTGALEIRGNIGGDVNAEVGDPNQDAGGPPPEFLSMFFQQSEVTMPKVAPGLTIAKDATIKGNLEYTQIKDANIPSNAVSGKVTRHQPVIDPATVVKPPTLAEIVMTWVFDLLRTIVTLSLLGLLLGWLAPAFMKTVMEKVQTKPVAALGWGVLVYAMFFFALLIVIVVMVIGGIIFGMLTLDSLTATTIWVGILAIFALIVFFVLATSFITKIAVAWLGGKLILSRINPAMAENKFLPLFLGVVILAVLMALPLVGWIFWLLAIFAGLGAIWMWGSELRQAKQVAQ